MANYEQLFLLEVLVDRVKLLTRALEAFAPECEDEPDTPVRIRVKFSDFPCFEITQDLAPVPKERRDSDALTTPIVFSSGKSCMFPMDPEQLMQDLIKYPMAVTVFKKNPESPLPEIIGQTKVPLGDYMTNIIKRAAEWSLEEPLSEMVQDTFPLRNAQEQDVGTITMLIRLTCFGKTIITKFQIADNKKSFLFKNAKTQDYEFKCKKCMPGQPILRPRSSYHEDTYEDEEEDEGDWVKGPYGYDEAPLLPCVESDQAPPQPCMSERPPSEMFASATPGFQRHELQGPGFTASMEVAYPEDCQDSYGPSRSGPAESQSTPTVKKEHSGKTKRGKSADSKKAGVENGVDLGTSKRKKRTKFHVPQAVNYPGVILGHKYCVARGPPIPAKNGWAWKTTVPAGMTWEDMRGWRPGAYGKGAWATMKAMEELRKMGKTKKIKRKPALPDTRKTTVHIHRIKGIYHVTMNPVKGPDDKEDPEPVVYTLERPEDGSDASELELDLTVPDPPYPAAFELKHQAQQFCEEDLPLQMPKSVFQKKKKKKKEKPPPENEDKKKKKPESAKSGKGKDKASAKGGDKKDAKEGDKKDAKGGDKKDAKGGDKKDAKGGDKKDAKGGDKKDAKGGDKKDAKGGDKKDAKGGDKKDAKGGDKKDAGKGKQPPGKAAAGDKGKEDKGGKKGTSGPPPKDSKGASAKDAGKDAGKGGKAPPETPQKGKKGKGKGKKKDDDDDIYPWDEWIMKLKCKNKKTPED